MKQLISILFLNLLTYTLGFNNQLPNNTVKLRTPANLCPMNDCTMSLNRREIMKLPFKSVSLSTLGFLSLSNPVNAKNTENFDDTWSKHNGPFSEEALGDYTKTNSGLLYKDVEPGNGNMPNDGDIANIFMVGYIFETGEKWCNTYKGIPTYQSFVRAGTRENQKFMKGLNEGVKTMKRGGKRILVIPAYLAYQYTTIFSDKNPDMIIIPGGANLVCYVELVDFKKSLDL